MILSFKIQRSILCSNYIHSVFKHEQSCKHHVLIISDGTTIERKAAHLYYVRFQPATENIPSVGAKEASVIIRRV